MKILLYSSTKLRFFGIFIYTLCTSTFMYKWYIYVCREREIRYIQDNKMWVLMFNIIFFFAAFWEGWT